MISKTLSRKQVGAEPGFQWRGDEITRVEGLSDAVFAFAVTLLVVSLEVPKSFDDFYLVIKGLPSFAMTFLLLMLIWYNQYKFFRRYGLQDFKTVVLTITLLFVIIFYVYPMKFLFSGMFTPIMDAIFPDLPKLKVNIVASVWDIRNLMILYHIGVIAVYGVFTWMYRHAYSQRERLDLTEIEIFDTKVSINVSAYFVCLGSLGLIMAITGGQLLISLSGIMYGPVSFAYFWISGSKFEKKRKMLLTKWEISAENMPI